MAGAIVIIVVLLMIPVGFLMAMTGVAGVLGWALRNDAAARYEGSELLELNR
jgi:hypothetical protein